MQTLTVIDTVCIREVPVPVTVTVYVPLDSEELVLTVRVEAPVDPGVRAIVAVLKDAVIPEVDGVIVLEIPILSWRP